MDIQEFKSLLKQVTGYGVHKVFTTTSTGEFLWVDKTTFVSSHIDPLNFDKRFFSGDGSSDTPLTLNPLS